jgi:hypothetical protein
MTIPRNLSFLAEGASSTGVLSVANGGTGVTSSTGTSKTVLSSLPAFDTTIGVGAATASASGAGITFPATQSASSNVNTLDDYEEGTWTPTQGAGLTVVGGFSSSGTYTKVGNLVYVSGIVQGGTSVTYAGGTSILTAGLPFTINSGYGGGGGNAVDSALAAGCGLVGNRGTDTIYGSGSIASTLRIFFSLTYVV